MILMRTTSPIAPALSLLDSCATDEKTRSSGTCVSTLLLLQQVYAGMDVQKDAASEKLLQVNHKTSPLANCC